MNVNEGDATMMPRLFATGATLILAVGSAAAQVPVELKLGFWTPPQAATNQRVLMPWIQSVETASEGTLKLNWYKGETLGNARTIYDNIANGIADVGWVIATSVPGRMPRYSVAGLPFLTDGLNAEQGAIALWRTYARGVFDPEFREVFPLATNLTPAALLHTTFPIRTLEDLKGRKLNAGAATLLLRQLGAVPVPIPISDLHQSIQRGVIEGTTMPWMGTDVFQVIDVTTHHVEVGWNSGYTAVLMNRTSFDRLPEKGKAAISQHTGEVLSRGYGKVFDDDNAAAERKARADAKHVITALDSAERARWQKAAQAITDEWLAKTPDGAKILATYREEIERVRTQMR